MKSYRIRHLLLRYKSNINFLLFGISSHGPIKKQKTHLLQRFCTQKVIIKDNKKFFY